MSSRTENKKRERSWERDDRDRDKYLRGSRGGSGSYWNEGRRRSSRSRSPRRGPDRDMDRDRRGGAGLSPILNYIYVLIYFIDKRDRDYRRDRMDDRRSDPRGDRERDRRGDDRRRDHGNDRREPPRRDDRDAPAREDRKPREYESMDHTPCKSETGPTG